MFLQPREFSILIVSVSLILLAGCGRSGDGWTGPRGTVSGQVTFEGKPIPEGCEVCFFGANGAYIGSGLTDKDGKYALRTAGTNQLPVLDYEIMIFAPKVKLDPKDATDPSRVSPTGIKIPFPSKYTSNKTSNLKYSVNQGANTADFKLEP